MNFSEYNRLGEQRAQADVDDARERAEGTPCPDAYAFGRIHGKLQIAYARIAELEAKLVKVAS